MEGLEGLQAKAEPGLDKEMQELRKRHAVELYKLGEEHKEEILLTKDGRRRREGGSYRRRELRWRGGCQRSGRGEKVWSYSRDTEEAVKARIEEVECQVEREELEMRLAEEWEREKVELQQRHEEAVKARIEEVSVRFQVEREELEMRLAEEWEREKVLLDEQTKASLQTVLEEQENRGGQLTEQWGLERARLQQCREVALLTRLAEERRKQQEETERRLREDWHRERLQLEEDYEGMLQERLQEETERRLREEWHRERLQLEEDYEGMLQERLQEERERLAGGGEEVEKRWGKMMEEEKERLKEVHRHAVQELSAKHSEEREQLSCLLDKLREDIAEKSLKLEHFRKEKISAQRKAESFKRRDWFSLLKSALTSDNGLEGVGAGVHGGVLPVSSPSWAFYT
ncbi:unnamed protein product [Coregonus sp. 'balchen']|nr:unnamed protein product [Coregonus sp. 'balchen']